MKKVLPILLGLSLLLTVLFFLQDTDIQQVAALSQPLGRASSTITVCLSGGCDYTNVQSAVDAAHEGDVIKVASGTYKDVHARPRNDITTTGSVTQVVYISKSISIKGGYTVTNWITQETRNNHTVLDARGQGRVIYITGQITPTVDGLHLTGGNADRLGGLWGEDAGGGVYVITAPVTLSDNAVYDNFGGDNGGGVCLLNTHRAILHSNDIYTNTASFGGGIEVRLGQAITLSSNRIYDNVAVDSYGGGIDLVGGETRLDNNVIAENRVESSGGAMYIYVGSARLRHNTIAHNVGGEGDGTGIYLQPHWTGMPATVALTNTILVGHEVGVYANEDSTATLNGTLWGADAWKNGTDWSGDGKVITGSHNYWDDPAFVDPDEMNYHIGVGSAAIDAGVATDVDTDIDGTQRPIGARPDLGADEVWKRVYLPLVVRSFK